MYRIPDLPSPKKRARTASVAPSTPPLSNSRSSVSTDSINLGSNGVSDLEEEMRSSKQRLVSAWTELAERYSTPLHEDDIVDLRTVNFVKNRGVLTRSNRTYEIGCFGDADESEKQQAVETDAESTYDEEEDLDELDALHEPTRPLANVVPRLPPLRPTMNPEDAEDLRDFLRAESMQRGHLEEDDDEEEYEESVEDEEEGDEGDLVQSTSGTDREESQDGEVSERTESSAEPEENRKRKPHMDGGRNAPFLVYDSSEDEFGGYDAGDGSLVLAVDQSPSPLPPSSPPPSSSPIKNSSPVLPWSPQESRSTREESPELLPPPSTPPPSPPRKSRRTPSRSPSPTPTRRPPRRISGQYSPSKLPNPISSPVKSRAPSVVPKVTPKKQIRTSTKQSLLMEVVIASPATVKRSSTVEPPLFTPVKRGKSRPRNEESPTRPQKPPSPKAGEPSSERAGSTHVLKPSRRISSSPLKPPPLTPIAQTAKRKRHSSASFSSPENRSVPDSAPPMENQPESYNPPEHPSALNSANSGGSPHSKAKGKGKARIPPPDFKPPVDPKDDPDPPSFNQHPSYYPPMNMPPMQTGGYPFAPMPFSYPATAQAQFFLAQAMQSFSYLFSGYPSHAVPPPHAASSSLQPPTQPLPNQAHNPYPSPYPYHQPPPWASMPSMNMPPPNHSIPPYMDSEKPSASASSAPSSLADGSPRGVMKSRANSIGPSLKKRVSFSEEPTYMDARRDDRRSDHNHENERQPEAEEEHDQRPRVLRGRTIRR
ncbi:hypothetical protein SISNIDRAFT_457641 [Sistotremastrum niveocremeum HHB9708]|uniref:Uncharacterized protein n=1 Tax=Sistotremastrum niveocremeum HHB9708 TaxID=1314777 RepID=A0A164REU5_9AGAM|nr:hypothetical protein SISNIDRAFT_457641 [Sistotremastrum niveocremeum HHB9708]